MSIKFAPLLGAAGAGLADEEIAILTKASVATKGSYIPTILFDAALAAAGIMVTPRMAPGPKRNALLGASVGGSALLGIRAVGIASGTYKL